MGDLKRKFVVFLFNSLMTILLLSDHKRKKNGHFKIDPLFFFSPIIIIKKKRLTEFNFCFLPYLIYFF